MATKKKTADPAKKLLLTAIKKTINHNTVLPILEDVYFTPTSAIVYDLETHVKIPFKLDGVPEGGICIPAKMLENVMGMTDTLTVKVTKDFSATFIEGSREMKLQGEDPMNYPIEPKGDYKHIGTLEGAQIDDIATALLFVSNDDLRPAMTGIFFGKDIAATDAHRMFWKPITQMEKEFILPQKAAKILLALGGKKWEIYHSESFHVRWINEVGVEVNTRVIDARFPDYPKVIPSIKEVAGRIISCPSMIMKEIANAQKFANRSTNQVKFEMTDKVKIKSEDVDFSFEYSSIIKGAEVHFKGDKTKEMSIAFNGKFLTQIIGLTAEDSPVEIDFWGPTKAAIINKHFLCMPLMLNS